jgi:peptidoglycan/LPS O-acetylase OafA/YrhL
MKKVFSGRLIIVIGGMCYSIYLLHFAVISFVGRLLVRSGVPVSNTSLFLLFVLFFVVSVLAVSAIYFVLIEKPFMRPIGLGRLHPSKAIAETKM